MKADETRIQEARRKERIYSAINGHLSYLSYIQISSEILVSWQVNGLVAYRIREILKKSLKN